VASVSRLALNLRKADAKDAHGALGSVMMGRRHRQSAPVAAPSLRAHWQREGAAALGPPYREVRPAQFTIAGLGDRAIQEARERVHAAAASS